MSYDDPCPDEPPCFRHIEPMNGRDLGAIVTLLEVATIHLSPTTGATFTKAELYASARELGGEEVPLLDKDLDIVMGMGMGYVLRKLPGGKYRMV